MRNQRQELLEGLSNLQVNVSLRHTSHYLVYFVNPLDYAQPICLTVQGAPISVLQKLVAGYYITVLRLAEENNIPLDTNSAVLGCILSVTTACHLLYPKVKISVSAVPHIVFNDMSGLTVHPLRNTDGVPSASIVGYSSGQSRYTLDATKVVSINS